MGATEPQWSKEDLEGARGAQERLERDLEGLDDATARRPSRLPGWTVGHVLTHVARNADSHRRVLEAAVRGEQVDRYPGGREQRAAEIEAGAGRPAAELVADVVASATALDATWRALPAEVWARPGTSMGKPEPIASLAFKRWREVEVHHADLGVGFSWRDWSPAYVRRELHHATLAWRASRAMGHTELPAAALALAPNERLAWLMGRVAVDGLPAVPQWW